MNNRALRVSELIKRELNYVLLKEIDFSEKVLVTIIEVQTSSNMIHSKIYISVVPESKAHYVLNILNKNVYRLQQEINKRLRIRPVPKIRFVEEKQSVKAVRIEKILEKIKKDLSS